MVTKRKDPADFERKGRPPVKIDLSVLETLAGLQATYEQIAAAFRCTPRTIIKKMKKRECREAYERGQEFGKLSLKRLQWKLANGTGSSAVNMAIHLSKHWLGETDKSQPIVNNVQTNNTLSLTHASESDLRALESVLARIADASASEGRVIEAGSGSAAPAG
jgi:hypothetical protein